MSSLDLFGQGADPKARVGKRVVVAESVLERVKAFTLLELLLVIVAITVIAGLLLPVLNSARRKASSTRCISNLRQLGIAVRLYGDENDGRLPSAQAFRQSQTGAGTGLPRIPQDVFKCPEDKRGIFEGEGSSYEWNTSLNGRILHRIGQDRPDESAWKTFLLRDREAWHPRGRRNAVFADGHVGPADL